MSAIAGRVLIIPQGAYNASSIYHMLDAVSYNGNSYIAKKTTQGNTPSADNEFWMLLSAGSAVASINDIGDVLITLPTDGQVLKYNATTQKWENGQDTGGLLPHLIIISEDGESEVKAVKGSTEIIATRTSAGHYECDVPEFGTWTIHAVLNGDDATVNLVVDTVKVYTVDDSHFHADITVTYPSGGTCSCSKSGETTLYATGSPYTFTVHSAGTWTITATAYGKTFTQTVNISESGQTVYTTVPDGETVTPTDDVQTLLACAGIGDSQITTLAELLADTTTLSAVINSNNAVDYMVRSTTWAVGTVLTPTIADNATAMTYIGLNNYAANTLLADATWCDAICNSEYFESVLNVKVPTMTGYTTPEGEVIYTSTSGSDYPWKAFNESATSGKYVDSRSDGYIGYIFPSTQKIYVADLHIHPDYYHTSMRLECSEDGVTWNNLTDFVNTPAGSNTKIITNNPSAMRYWRVYGQGAVSNYVYMYWMNFYGREDV